MNFLTLEGLSAAGQAAAIGGALGAVGILVVMYFLKLKRTRREISSTFLWKRSVQDIRANSPFQRLRRNLLLFLQLAVLLAALLALGRPALLATARGGATYIVLLDNSASMAATDAAPNRLAAAAGKVQALIDDMTPQDSMMLLTFGSHPRVVATLTDDKDALSAALATVETLDSTTKIEEPLELADSLARNLANARILVVSDGAFGKVAPMEFLTTPVEYVSVGERSRNVGITAIDVRRSMEEPSTGEIFARVTNFSSEAVKTNVSLAIDGQLADASATTIEPGGAQSSVFKVRLDAERTAEVSVDAADDLAADNRAWAMLEPPGDVRVTIVGTANPFLVRALNAPGRFKVSQSESEGQAAGEGAGVVYVYDGAAPSALGRAGYLIFDAVAPAEGFSDKGALANPVILDVDTSHPVTAFLDLGDIFIEKARKMTFPPETKTLVSSDEGALVALSYVGAARVLTVAFNPMDSRWPLRISYPMFVANAVEFLASAGRGPSSRQFPAGEVLVLQGEPDTMQITVEDPDGRVSTLACDGESNVAFGRTGKAGIYTARTGTKVVSYAANLTSGEESNTMPVKEFDVGSRKVTASETATLKNREIWRELLIVALVVLMVEWYIYNRRVYV